MAKGKRDIIVSNNSLVAELREVKWLNNPVIYSQVSGDFSPMQQRVLIGIIEQMQPQIQQCIDEQKRTGIWGPLFSKTEKGEETLDMHLDPRVLGVASDGYKELEEAAEQLADVTMKYPSYDKKGRIHHYVKAPLFARLEMPAHINDNGETGYKKGYLRVVMLKENINDYFNMNQGYSQHVARIAQIARVKRTPRLYIYFCRYRDAGHKIVPYRDLCEFLGLTDEYYMVEKPKKRKGKDGEEVIEMERPKENPYSKFTKVKKLVLEPTKVEMDDLMARGEIDFTFDYEPIYENGRKRGNPTSLLFSFTKGPLGELHDVMLKRSAQERTLIGWFIKHCPDLKNTELIRIVTAVDDMQWEQFRQYAYTAIELMEKADADNGAAYIVSLLKDWKVEEPCGETQGMVASGNAEGMVAGLPSGETEGTVAVGAKGSWLDRFRNPTEKTGQEAWRKVIAESKSQEAKEALGAMTVDKIEAKTFCLSGTDEQIERVERLLTSVGKDGQLWLLRKLTEYSQMEIKGLAYRAVGG